MSKPTFSTTLTMKIIPALYIKEGKLAYYNPGEKHELEFLPYDPYELIEELGNHHIDRVMLIDMDGSMPNDLQNIGLIGSLCNTTVIDLEVGGGIANMDHLKSLQYAGVDYFVLGTVALSNFNFLREINESKTVKNERVLISLDVRAGRLVTHGLTKTVTNITLDEMIWKCINAGFNRFIVTEVEVPALDIAFYQRLAKQFPGARFAASGGIHTFEQIKALEDVGIQEVIIGDGIYRGEGLIKKIADFNRAHNE